MWLYNNNTISSLSDLGENEPFGFVYKITNLTNGKFYIGKKNIYSKVNKPITKKELGEIKGPGRKPKKKLVIKEADWINYVGSNKTLVDDIKNLGKENFKKEILRLCYSSKELTFWESCYQFKLDVLFVDSYNDNIAAKHFRSDFNK